MTYYRNRNSNFRAQSRQANFAHRGQAEFFDPSSLVDAAQHGVQWAGNHLPNVDLEGLRSGAGQALEGLRSGAGQAWNAVGDNVGNIASGVMNKGRQAMEAFGDLPTAAKGTIAAAGGGLTAAGAGLVKGMRPAKKAASPWHAQQLAKLKQMASDPNVRRGGMIGAGVLGAGALGLGGKMLYDRSQQSADMHMRTRALAEFTSNPENLALFSRYY